MNIQEVQVFFKMNTHACSVVAAGVLALLTANADEEKIDSRMFELEYANCEEVARSFNLTWRGTLASSTNAFAVAEVAAAFPEANSVMVTATPSILDACEKMVKKLDRKPRQLYVEARFVELKNNAEYNLGIHWGVLNNLAGTAGFSAGVSQQNIPDGISEYSQTKSGGGLTQAYKFTSGGRQDNSYFQGTLSFSEMSLVLAAFQGSEDIKTFSNPRVVVSSGKEAIVDMTRKRPNVVVSAKRVVNGSNNTLDLDMKIAPIPGEDKMMFAKEAFFSWGISLNVLPRVSTNGLINVRIVPTISSCSEYVVAEMSGATGAEAVPSSRYPIIDMQRLVTEFNMKSGMTAVIGGLSKTEEQDIDTGIPWLCDIPWIGSTLFGGKSRQKVQSEILVFVTVGLADADDMPEDVGLPKNAVLGRGYTNGTRKEPGERRSAVEGVKSLDLRALEDRAAESVKED